MIPHAITISRWRPRIRAVWRYYAYEVLATAGAALAVACALGLAMSVMACQTIKDVGGEIGGTAAEWIACPTDLVDCGHVFLFEAIADNPLGHVELCVNDDDDPDALAAAEAVYGLAEPTPRHQGLCIWGCPPDAPGLPEGRGGNAYSGVWGCP
jgi:hypothetical protein